ncbi:MAG: hypothetical protein DRP19_02085 [Thermotogae bacterium]|nr:MAG: hypothetical protein DRP19_02085 [Thermotogota bacterium]
MWILKIVIRNFIKSWKSTLLTICGAMICSALVIGSLSLNDSVSSWNQSKIQNNFGRADAYVISRSSSMFFTPPIQPDSIERLRRLPVVENIIAVNQENGRVEFEDQSLECLVIATDSEELSKFSLTDLQLGINEAIVGKSLAHRMKISPGDEITIITPQKKLAVKVSQIGKEGFLNFRGNTGTLTGTVFVNKLQFNQAAVNRLYLSYSVPLDQHNAIFDYEIPNSVRIVNMKSNLINSPANKSLGYLMIAFSSLSILSASFLVVVFSSSLANERKRTYGILKVLGVSKRIPIIFVLEGLLYFLSAAVVGIFVGLFVGSYLLKSFTELSSGFLRGTPISLEGISYHVSPTTILIGTAIGILLPIFIILFRAVKIYFEPASLSMKESVEEKVSFRKRLTLLFPFFLGIFLFLGNFLLWKQKLEEPDIYYFFFRGLVHFTAVSLLVFSLISLLRITFVKLGANRGMALSLGLTYVERFPRRSILIGIMFSLIIFVMVILTCVSFNVTTFLKEKTRTGLFGYDFLVMGNPLKLAFQNELPVNEKLITPAKASVAKFESNSSSEAIIFVDDSFLENVVVSFEGSKEWRQLLKEPNTVVVGTNTAISLLKGTVTSFLPFGGSGNVSFNVVATFDPRDIVLPIRYIASSRNLPSNINTIQVLVGRVTPQNVQAVKRFYSSQLHFPVYIREELLKLFSGIEKLISISSFILYFGLISGLSALSLYSFRAYILRRRTIGMLRAIGMKSKDIFYAFLTESLALVSVGVVIGIASGLLVSKELVGIMFSLFGSGNFGVPIHQILGVLVITYGLSLITVLVPAILSARLSPAESLRSPE